VEIYIIYCVAIVAMILLRLRLDVAHLSVFGPIIGFTSTEASTLYAENSEVLASSSCLNRLMIGRFSGFLHFIKSQFYNPTSMQNVSITKLLEPWIICKGVFNSSNWRERRCKCRSDWQQICCVFKIFTEVLLRNKKIIVIV
jgi:hypothetical protein